jgi:hypothetical protein
MFKTKTILGALVVALVATTVATAQPQKDYKWDVQAPIPDLGEIFNTQIVPDDSMGLNTIADVNVDLHIEHTWQGDLIIDLTHGGVTVPLLYRAGDSAGAGGVGFSANNLGTFDDKFILDDEANEAYDSDLGWGTIPDPGIDDVTGSWIPYGQFNNGGIGGLGAFDGMDKRGEWIFHVSDNAGGDTGILHNWSLHFENVPEPTSLMLLVLCGLPLLLRRR